MKSNTIINNLFKRKEDEMKSSLQQTQNIKHPTTKGDITESKWIQWLAGYLPKRYKVEKAFIVDYEGNISDQIDAVIYDNYYSPFIFSENDIKYIPVESVYAVFEIKQGLNATNIEYAMNKVESVRKLKITSKEIRQINDTKIAKKPLPIIGGLITTYNGWKEQNTSKNLLTNITKYSTTKNKNLNLVMCLDSATYKIIQNTDEAIDIIKSEDGKTLFYFFFWLLIMLQDHGNSPAIDYEEYGIKNAYKGVDENE